MEYTIKSSPKLLIIVIKRSKVASLQICHCTTKKLITEF